MPQPDPTHGPTGTVPTAQPVAPDDRPAIPARRRRSSWGLGFWLALAWLVVALVASVAADVLPLPSATQGDFSALSERPSTAHLLGTDAQGRDLLARIVYGARVSLTVGVAAVVVGLLVGSGLGVVAGYFRGGTERVIASLADAVLSFPALVLLLGLGAVLGPSMRTLVIGLALVTVPAFIRLTRASSMQVSQQEFVVAARTTGAGSIRVMLREVVPNVAPGALAYGFIIVAIVIVAEGALSFLGLGVPPPTPSWGGMIAEGRTSLGQSPHITLVPSAALFLTVFAFNVLGDQLRARFDVRESTL